MKHYMQLIFRTLLLLSHIIIQIVVMNFFGELISEKINFFYFLLIVLGDIFLIISLVYHIKFFGEYTIKKIIKTKKQ